MDLQSDLINKAIEFAKVEYEKNDPLHRWSHVHDVMQRASDIAELSNESIDHELLKLAIIFHDIDYNSGATFEESYNNHPDYSVKVAVDFLMKNNYPVDKIDRIKEIMLDHSTPHRKVLGEAKSIEGKIIYDADKSIGIDWSKAELRDKYYSKLYLDETRAMVDRELA
jgi:HD superfamily phosphodiesterase